MATFIRVHRDPGAAHRSVKTSQRRTTRDYRHDEPDLTERVYRGWDGIGFRHPDAG
jgi:hypothetical protein